MIDTRQFSENKPSQNLTLFYCPGHMSFAPHVILNELGSSFDLIHVSIKEGATQTADFKRLNPKGKVPVLLAGPQTLTEASAILMYLALSHPAHKLLPDAPMGVARAVEWMNWLGAILSGTVGLNFHPSRFSADIDAHESIRRKGRESILAAYAQIDERLQGHTWGIEEQFSIVDPMLLIFFKWGNMLGLNMHQFQAWEGHALRMLERPSVIRTIETERITVWE